MKNLSNDIEPGGDNSGSHGIVASEATLLLNPSQLDFDCKIAKNDTVEPYLSVVSEELCWIASSSSLTILTGSLQLSFTFVNVMSMGSLGANELAAMVISVSVLIALVIAPSVGLMSAMETFCSTAFTASSDKTAVGFHFQRGIIAAFAHFIIVVPIMWNSEKLLLAMGQEKFLAKLCSQYLRIHILGVLPWTLFEACKRFLNSQGIMRAGTIILLYSAPFHCATNFFLVRSETYNIGFIGAPIANIATEWLMFLSAVVYIYNSRAMETWGGWDYSTLRNMSEYWRLAIPSVITICSDWVGFQIATVVISYFGVHQVAGHGIMLNTITFNGELSMCIGAGTGPRIGNLIGAAKPRQARISGDVAIGLSMLASGLGIIFLALYGEWWITVFTNNSSVIHEATKLLPLSCVLLTIDGLNALLVCIMRGLGRQKISAIVNLVGFNILAPPLELTLGFWISMQATGIWLGLCIGAVFICAVQLVYLYGRIDWKEEVRLCHIRLCRSRKNSETAGNALLE